MTQIIIETPREGYATDQIRNTLTVAELIDILSDFDPEAKIFTSHDNGYTYGGITKFAISECENEDEE